MKIVVYLGHNVFGTKTSFHLIPELIPFSKYFDYLSNIEDNFTENIFIDIIVSGFPDLTAAKQFIWRWNKIISLKLHSDYNSNIINSLKRVILMKKPSTLAIPFTEWKQKLIIHFKK
jgi:hypothetical protein